MAYFRREDGQLVLNHCPVCDGCVIAKRLQLVRGSWKLIGNVCKDCDYQWEDET